MVASTHALGSVTPHFHVTDTFKASKLLAVKVFTRLPNICFMEGKMRCGDHANSSWTGNNGSIASQQKLVVQKPVIL